MSLYHQWNDDSLTLDVEIDDTEGKRKVRTDIKKERIREMLASDPEGLKFFLREVLKEVRPNIKMDPMNLHKAVQFPDMAREILNRPQRSADDLLPPQVLEMEQKHLPPYEIQGYLYEVG